jgi:hypothetical protein
MTSTPTITPILDVAGILAAAKGKLPIQLATLVDQYGPAFAAMGKDAVWSWYNLILSGDIKAAYAQVLARLPDEALLDEWSKADAAWAAQNQTNADSIALQKAVLTKIVLALVAIAGAVAGF